MRRCMLHGLEWLEFDLFHRMEGISHGFFLRQGGVSEGGFSSLNMSEYVGDDPGAVQENWERVSAVTGTKKLVRARQCHGDFVVDVGDGNRTIWDGCDGLVTASLDVGLVIRHADCQAVLLYDPRTRVVAAVHAGWRGQVLDIYARTLDVLRVRYGTRPEDVFVGISPSIGPVHMRLDYSSIDGGVYLPEIFFEFEEKPLHFNLWRLAARQFELCGVPKKHIEVASMCTYAQPEDFFSYRRDKGITGRHASWISLV